MTRKELISLNGTNETKTQKERIREREENNQDENNKGKGVRDTVDQFPCY